MNREYVRRYLVWYGAGVGSVACLLGLVLGWQSGRATMSVLTLVAAAGGLVGLVLFGLETALGGDRPVVPATLGPPELGVPVPNLVALAALGVGTAGWAVALAVLQVV